MEALSIWLEGAYLQILRIQKSYLLLIVVRDEDEGLALL